MKKTIVKKIITILLLTILGIVIYGKNVCYAEYIPNLDSETGGGVITPLEQSEKKYSLADAIQQAIDFIIHGKESADVSEANIKSANDAIFNVLVIIGTILTVIIGGILGIQFLIASAEDKAKIKESFIPYVIGNIIIFGAFGIWKIVVEILNANQS